CPHDASLQLPLRVAQLFCQPAALERSDSVLAGESAAESECGTEELAGSFPHVRGYVWAVEDEVRVQVPVARMSDGGDRERILALDAGDLVEHRGHRAARHGDV